MGIAVVMFELPLGGERGMARTFDGNVFKEVHALTRHGCNVDAEFLGRAADAVCEDFRLIRSKVLVERYGLTSERIAVYGVSLGCVMSSLVFMRDGFAERLLGVIGHAHVPRFARSYGGTLLPFVAASPLGGLAQLVLGNHWSSSLIPTFKLLHQLIHDYDNIYGNPMHYADRVAAHRRVRFLVGEDDPLVSVDDAKQCAAQFADGACYVVPGLAHGPTRFGPDFEGHVCFYLTTQLGDWSW